MADSLFNSPPRTAAELMRQLGFKFPGTASAAPVPPPALPLAPLAAPADGVRAVEPRPAPARRTLHVTNGDVAAEGLRASGLAGIAGIAGDVAVTADLLHEGPVPGNMPLERWRKVRARYLAESGYDDYDSCLARLTRWDHTLEAAGAYGEVVLWFEHDLFDQLLLIRTVDLLTQRDSGATELTLLSVGELPGVVPFYGLGQLSPPQLASLYPARTPVDTARKLLARDAWRAFRAPDPREIEAILRRDTTPLPHLAGALRRHLEDFPGVADGLARSERQILRAVERGAASFEQAFRATQAMEERVFLGDLSFHRLLRELAAPPRPLLRLETAGGTSPRALRLALTRSGREVLAGKDDWVRMRGIDRWLGGVHLEGTESPWRWNPETERLARS
jgi:hypothetical protein